MIGLKLFIGRVPGRAGRLGFAGGGGRKGVNLPLGGLLGVG